MSSPAPITLIGTLRPIFATASGGNNPRSLAESARTGTFSFFKPLHIVVKPSAAQLTSDAGLLPIRDLDAHLHLTEQFAQALDDSREPRLVQHTLLEMSRARVYGILAD